MYVTFTGLGMISARRPDMCGVQGGECTASHGKGVRNVSNNKRKYAIATHTTPLVLRWLCTVDIPSRNAPVPSLLRVCPPQSDYPAW